MWSGGAAVVVGVLAALGSAPPAAAPHAGAPPEIPAGTGTLGGVVRVNGDTPRGLLVSASAVTGAPVPRAGGPPDAMTDDAGRFRLSLAAGRYVLRVSDPAWSLPDRWYPAASSERAAIPVEVQAGGHVDGLTIDASFQPDFPGHPRVRARGPRLPAGVRDRPMDGLAGYDGQEDCLRSPRRGTVALARLLQRTYGRVGYGLNRSCVKGDRSEHYDGRAVDWHVTQRDPRSARKGDDFVKWLTRSEGRHLGAMAQRLGVMYVIWRNRIWQSYRADKGWVEFRHCFDDRFQTARHDSFCHRDHVHISLGWAGARMATSWWRD